VTILIESSWTSRSVILTFSSFIPISYLSCSISILRGRMRWIQNQHRNRRK
jgi:hypothetical protein